MSLKAFHLVFITAATVLAFGCGVWWVKEFASPGGRVTDLGFGLGAVAAGVALIVYERYFIKKLVKVSYF